MPRSKHHTHPDPASAERAIAPQHPEVIMQGRTHVVRKGVEYLTVAMFTGEQESRERTLAVQRAAEDPIDIDMSDAASFTVAHDRAVQAQVIQEQRAHEKVMRIHSDSPVNIEVPS